jgi:hypothetical protein
VRQPGRLDPLLEDIQGYLELLHRHGFLRYHSDSREYTVKRMVVIDGIVRALEQATNVSLPVLYDEIPVENLREVSRASVERLIRETIRNLKRSLQRQEAGLAGSNGHQKAIQRWEAALHALRFRAPRAVHA